MNAVVLAGGPPDEVAALQPGAPNKAFVPIAGVPMVQRTLQSLREAPSIERIIVVVPRDARNDAALAVADDVRDDGVKIRDSLRHGLAGLDPDTAILVSTSDLPLLSTVAIEDFVTRARALDADLVYGCVEKRDHDARFPEFPHTWARLRDGRFCGTGFIVMKPRALPRLEAFIERLGHARKNPLSLASIFGFRVLARFAIGRLSIAHAERRAEALLGAPVRALVSRYPEIAVNVDRVSDVPLAARACANV